MLDVSVVRLGADHGPEDPVDRGMRVIAGIDLLGHLVDDVRLEGEPKGVREALLLLGPLRADSQGRQLEVAKE